MHCVLFIRVGMTLKLIFRVKNSHCTNALYHDDNLSLINNG